MKRWSLITGGVLGLACARRYWHHPPLKWRSRRQPRISQTRNGGSTARAAAIWRGWIVRSSNTFSSTVIASSRPHGPVALSRERHAPSGMPFSKRCRPIASSSG